MFGNLLKAFKESLKNERNESFSTIRKWQKIEKYIEGGNNHWGYCTGECYWFAHEITDFIIRNKLDPNRPINGGVPVIHYFRRWNSVFIVGCCNNSIKKIKEYGANEDLNCLPTHVDDNVKNLMAYKNPYDIELLSKTVPL